MRVGCEGVGDLGWKGSKRCVVALLALMSVLWRDVMVG